MKISEATSGPTRKVTLGTPRGRRGKLGVGRHSEELDGTESRTVLSDARDAGPEEIDRLIVRAVRGYVRAAISQVEQERNGVSLAALLSRPTLEEDVVDQVSGEIAGVVEDDRTRTNMKGFFGKVITTMQQSTGRILHKLVVSLEGRNPAD